MKAKDWLNEYERAQIDFNKITKIKRSLLRAMLVEEKLMKEGKLGDRLALRDATALYSMIPDNFLEYMGMIYLGTAIKFEREEWPKLTLGGYMVLFFTWFFIAGLFIIGFLSSILFCLFGAIKDVFKPKLFKNV